MLELNSSVIRAVDYDPEARTLEVLFPSGKIYCYSGVPEWKYDGLTTAQSAGEYFNSEIRDQYPFRSSN